MHMHVNLFPYRMGDESGVQVQVHENENEKEHDKVWLISLFADAGFVALLLSFAIFPYRRFARV